MENPLKYCLTIQVSEENANSTDFDLSNYMNKKIKETWFKKALGLNYSTTPSKVNEEAKPKATVVDMPKR